MWFFTVHFTDSCLVYWISIHSRWPARCASHFKSVSSPPPGMVLAVYVVCQQRRRKFRQTSRSPEVPECPKALQEQDACTAGSQGGDDSTAKTVTDLHHPTPSTKGTEAKTSGTLVFHLGRNLLLVYVIMQHDLYEHYYRKMSIYAAKFTFPG